jgi:hypothetical protein
MSKISDWQGRNMDYGRSVWSKATALAIVLAVHGLAVAEGFLDGDTTVEYDGSNRVMLPVQQDHPDGLLLHVVADGQTTRIIGPFSREHAISTQVWQIAYAGNKNELWALSRLGRRLDGAVKIDLRSGKIKEEHEGVSFSLSPDGTHIAYVYPDGQPDKFGALFVDDCLVFPVFERGFTDPFPKSDPPGPAKKSGERYLTYVQEWNRKHKLGLARPALYWADDTTLEMGVDSGDVNTTAPTKTGRLTVRLASGAKGFIGAKGKVQY